MKILMATALSVLLVGCQSLPRPATVERFYLIEGEQVQIKQGSQSHYVCEKQTRLACSTPIGRLNPLDCECKLASAPGIPGLQ